MSEHKRTFAAQDTRHRPVASFNCVPTSLSISQIACEIEGEGAMDLSAVGVPLDRVLAVWDTYYVMNMGTDVMKRVRI